MGSRNKNIAAVIGGANLDAPLLTDGGDAIKMGIDDVLSSHAGEFGRWQLRHFVLTNIAWALEAMHTMVMIFSDRNIAAVVGDTCTVEGQPPWQSTVAEWGLVCGEKYKVGLVQAGFFAGCMIGAGVFGHLSDSFLGRKGSLTIVCALNAVFGLLTSISPSYWVYAALRFLTGFSTGGVGLCAFVLATEPVGPGKRGLVGMSTFYFFSGGIALLSGIAYVFRSWRELYIVSSLPSLIFLVAVLPFVSESPRWYLVRRKFDKAMDVIRRIAKTNGNHLPANISLKLDDDDEEKESSEKNGQHVVEQAALSGSIIDVIRSPSTRMRLILSVAINFLCSIVYYGINLNVVNLKTNLYLSVFLNSVSEFPAYILTAVLLDRFGRKPLAIATMWFSGVFCVAGLFVGEAEAMKTVRMVCGVLGIFGMAATYNLLFIYTTELFPTVVRNAALGCATQAAQMGAILAPLVVVLGESIPFAVFGVCGIVGGILAFYLPETMNQPLYDTMAGMESGVSKLVE